MANPNIGEIDCEACEKRGAVNTRAFVRKDRNGKLYVLCPRCGKVTRGNPAGQDYLLTYARLYAPEKAAAEAERAEREAAEKAAASQSPPPPEPPAPVVAPAPDPIPRYETDNSPKEGMGRRGFFADIDL